jgi:type III restriction enzyme
MWTHGVLYQIPINGRSRRRLPVSSNDDSVLELRPNLVGPSITRNSGIIGEGVDMSLTHLGDIHVTQRLLYTKWRDPGEEPKLHLFGQFKRITKQWLDTCLGCKGGTYPALLMYQELADMACNRITAAITRQFLGERPIKALLDPYNHTGSTRHVGFNTSRADRRRIASQGQSEQACFPGASPKLGVHLGDERYQKIFYKYQYINWWSQGESNP